jgi:hypothetical protein
LVLVGTFKPILGGLNVKVVNDICHASVVDARARLPQLLDRQGPYGIQVGVTVVFFTSEDMLMRSSRPRLNSAIAIQLMRLRLASGMESSS